jgi:hypothetical protein
MSDAEATHSQVKEMLVLREEFSSDAMGLDAAFEEMGKQLEQQSGVFVNAVRAALQLLDFGELAKLLYGFRGLPSSADQEQYGEAIGHVLKAGEEKYKAASQIIATISEDAHCELPKTVEQLPALLSWIADAERL